MILKDAKDASSFRRGLRVKIWDKDVQGAKGRVRPEVKEPAVDQRDGAKVGKLIQESFGDVE